MSMMDATITGDEQATVQLNRETWNFWKEDCGYYEGLALDVHLKVEAGLPLSELEQKILSEGLTTSQVEIVKANLVHFS